MRVLVTGAAGQVGTEVVARARAPRRASAAEGAPLEVIAADHAALDVADRDAVLARSRRSSPTSSSTRPPSRPSTPARGPRRAYRGERARHPPRRRGGPPRRRPRLLRLDRLRLRRHQAAPVPRVGRRPTRSRSTAAPSSAASGSSARTATIVRTSWVCGRIGANMVKTVLRLLAEAERPAAIRRRPARLPDDRAPTSPAVVDLAPRAPARASSTSRTRARRPGTSSPARSSASPAATPPGRADRAPTSSTRPAGAAAGELGARQRRPALSGSTPAAGWEESDERARRRAAGLSVAGREPTSAAARRSAPSSSTTTPATRCSTASRASAQAASSEIVVVDNASTDGSLALAAGPRTRRSARPAGRNLGYGAGREPRREAARRAISSSSATRTSSSSRRRLERLRAALDAAARCRGRRADAPRAATARSIPPARSFPGLGDALGHALRRSVLARTTLDPPLPARRARPARGPETPTGSRGAAFLVRRVAFEASAASTRPTSCTSRTSTSAGASTGPDGRCSTSRPPASCTNRAALPRATPTACWRRTTGRSSLRDPLFSRSRPALAATCRDSPGRPFCPRELALFSRRCSRQVIELARGGFSADDTGASRCRGG